MPDCSKSDHPVTAGRRAAEDNLVAEDCPAAGRPASSHPAVAAAGNTTCEAMEQATPYASWSVPARHVGQMVLVYSRLASTNSTAAELAGRHPDGGAGLAVVADYQTAGRGRHGRSWTSRPGQGLLLSVVVVPPPELRRPVVLTAWAAVAVAAAVDALIRRPCRIKWPNDLLLAGRKVCGILIEQHGPRVVAGIGLNLTQTAEDFAAAGLPQAISLAMACGQAVDRRYAAECILDSLDANYRELVSGNLRHVEAKWVQYMELLGRAVRVECSEGQLLYGYVRELGFAGIELEAFSGGRQRLVPEQVVHLDVWDSQEDVGQKEELMEQSP